jgi:site-specific DNA recombinase
MPSVVANSLQITAYCLFMIAKDPVTLISALFTSRFLEELQTELIQKANSKEAYDNIVNEIYRLRDLRQETLSRNALRQDKRDRIAEMTDFLNTQTSDIAEFDDKLVRKLVEKATVYDDRLVVEFKSGLEIEVKL